jgi:nicotinate-nucleotide adenylyltransferase
LKTIIFGGTFNPIHLGHLYVLHSLALHTDYQRVILLPSSQPPHKHYQQDISDEDRLELLHRALDDYTTLYPDDRPLTFVIDTCEIDRGGKSYMYDSVLDISQRYDITGTLALAIGDDLLPNLMSWHEADKLIKMLDFVVISREFTGKGRTLPDLIHGTYLEVTHLECSSTSIREQLKSTTGCIYALKDLLSESVLDYIIDYELYRNN